jgi:hypothetical protein
MWLRRQLRLMTTDISSMTNVSGRLRDETQEYDKDMFDFMDVSPKNGIFSRYGADSVPSER